MTSQMKVLFCGTVYYAVHGGSIFECVNDILKSGSYRAVLCCSTVYYVAQDSSNFESVDEIL